MAYTGAGRRWDIFWADLDPAIGSEQRGKRRPVIVISNDGYNKVFETITVLSATKLEGKSRKVYPFEVALPKGTITAEWASIVMPQQVRAISKKRLLSQIGSLEDDRYRAEIENRLLEHLDIAFEPDDEGSAG